MPKAKKTQEGRIYRSGKDVIVEITGSTHLASKPGVECINPYEEEAKRIYRKVFSRKPIYMPKEYGRAVAENLSGHDVLAIGVNGYSSLTTEQCRAWGVVPGAYDAACYSRLVGLVGSIDKEFDGGADVRFVHGASNMGIDAVTIKVAKKFRNRQLGHSCPKFMFYVDDDDVPVYVARNKDDYTQAFINSLHVLICFNGRAHAYEQDIDAACKLHKPIIPVNILKSISSTGGPPAFNANGGVEDAVAAVEKTMYMISMQFGQSSRNQLKEIGRHINESVTVIAQRILSPELAFGNCS